MRVAVVYDKSNLDESREKMVQSVFETLSKHFEAELVAFEDQFIDKVTQFDAVFNLSTAAMQTHVPAILELLKIPSTGSGIIGHALCIDKTITKIILNHYGVPTPKFISLEPGQETIPPIDFYPVIVKPSREGSARGLSADSVVKEDFALKKAVKVIHNEFHQPALIEQFVDGREFSVGIVAGEILPILEIDFSTLPDGLERFYSYRVKHYYGEQTRYICPAQIDTGLKDRISEYALTAFKALRLRNYARMDLRVKDGQIYFLEVNSLPMLTPGYSDIVKMAEAAGYTYEDLIMKIFMDAIENYEI
ncbi:MULTISPECIES: D-alanine--D-alanine ligase family protein [Pseudothermotoga]|jgi:D-alanine-D-alanine ligase|uniref:D-alanine--D-alanine ligase family protein n=1 Tax=Pseudothermotoga TaxID=1643951 RepID=UPI0004195DB8|nr:MULTISPECIES: ATP-grasp domain-containing protein [Pseudothermotoga]HBJ81729.1 D-alanine--D-alanine ligase [Pseudothermotoga sp.]